MNDDALYQEIGRLIRAIRIDRKMTQQALGIRVGMLRTSVVNAEAGRQRFPVHTLYRIAAALNCTIFDLMPESVATLPVLAPKGDIAWM